MSELQDQQNERSNYRPLNGWFWPEGDGRLDSGRISATDPYWSVGYCVSKERMTAIQKLLVILLGAWLSGCAADRANRAGYGPDPTGMVGAQVRSIAEPVKSEYHDATELDVYLMSMVEDVQSLAYALRLVEPADTENDRFVKDVLVDMLDLKLLSLAQFLPSTDESRVVGLACRALEQATNDIFIATNSCSETHLCERSHDLALVCVAEGFATEEEIAIPQHK